MSTLYYPEGFFVTTLSSDLTATASSIPLTAVPARITVGYMVIEPSSATKREVVYFTSVGATSVTTGDDPTDASDATGRGCLGSVTLGGATVHTQGSAVIISAVEQYWVRLYTVFTQNHNADGTHKTLTDSSGNEWLGVGVTASAVNYLKTTNAATGNAPTVEAAGDNTDIDLDVKGKGAGKVNIGGADVNLNGTNPNIQVGDTDPWRTISIFGGMKPTTTAGCASKATVEAGTNDIDYDVLDFDTSSDENAFVNFLMPDSYDGGVVQFRYCWTNAAGLTTETVTFELSGRALDNDGAIDQAVGTAIEVADTWIAQGDIHISAWSGDVTLAGSPAGGQWVHFEVMRDVSEDNLTGDARLMDVQIRYKQAKFTD